MSTYNDCTMGFNKLSINLLKNKKSWMVVLWDYPLRGETPFLAHCTPIVLL
jgi:hypothetical protein